MKTTTLLLVSIFTFVSLGGLSALVFSCYSLDETVQSNHPYAHNIKWPQGLKPTESDIFMHSEINIKAPPQLVWDIISNAGKWPEWYKKAGRIRLLNAHDGKLNQYSIFSWSPAGQFTSAV